jgi:hypothetical protein
MRHAIAFRRHATAFRRHAIAFRRHATAFMRQATALLPSLPAWPLGLPRGLAMLRPVMIPAGGCAAVGAVLLLAPLPGRSEVLYKLDTQCSLAGAPPQPCTVEAVNEGTATLYRHRIGAVTETIRVTEAPVRMSRWIEASKTWEPLKAAAARFSRNTVCFNGRQLCVVNPNYLNSVRQDNPNLLAQRDLVKVRFDSTGRMNASCYDDGCEGDSK